MRGSLTHVYVYLLEGIKRSQEPDLPPHYLTLSNIAGKMLTRAGRPNTPPRLPVFVSDIYRMLGMYSYWVLDVFVLT